MRVHWSPFPGGPVWPVLMSAALTQTALNLARPTMSYRVVALGGDGTDIGVVTAAYALLPVVLTLLLGRWTERLPRVWPLTVAGALLLALAPAWVAVSGSVVTIAIAATFLGVGHLLFLVSAQATMVRLAPESGLDRAFGLLTAAVSTGQLVGPLLIGVVVGDSTGAVTESATRRALLASSAIALAALPVFLPRRGRRSPPAFGSATPSNLPSWALLRRRGVGVHLLVSMALAAAIDILVAYLPLLALQRGISPAVVGQLLAVRALAVILSRLSLERMLHHWSRHALIVVSAGGTGLSLALLPLPATGTAAVVLMTVSLAVSGLIMGIGAPLTMTQLALAVPPDSRSTILALNLLANRVGQVGIPAFAGLAASAAGAAGAVWACCSVLVCASAAATRRPGIDPLRAR